MQKVSKQKLRVFPDARKETMYFSLQHLKEQILKVIVQVRIYIFVFVLFLFITCVRLCRLICSRNVVFSLSHFFNRVFRKSNVRLFPK